MVDLIFQIVVNNTGISLALALVAVLVGMTLKRRFRMVVSLSLNRSNLRCLRASILLGALAVLPLQA